MPTDKEKRIIFYKGAILRLSKDLDEHSELEKKINLFQIKIKDLYQDIRNIEAEILKLQNKEKIEYSIMQAKIIYADLLLSN